MPDEIVDELVERIREKKVVVVTGTGVSMAATAGNPLASWIGLIRNGIDRCITLRRATDEAWGSREKKRLQGDLYDLLGVADQVSRRLGWSPRNPCDGDWLGWLERTIGRLCPKNPDLLKAIHGLDVPIATLNYDSLLEQITGYWPWTWQEVEHWNRVLEGRHPRILHLHGYWETPSSVVLGFWSYDTLLNDNRAQHMQRVLATVYSLLFIGCRGTFQDPNFTSLLTWMSTHLEGFPHHHYVLLCHDEQLDIPRDLQDKAHLVPVFCRAHIELPTFIRNLTATIYPSSPLRDAVDSFINSVTEKSLSQYLNDVGLSELAAHWLAHDAPFDMVWSRLIIKTLALLANHFGKTTGNHLLNLIEHQPFSNDVAPRLTALLNYIESELANNDDVKQVIVGQRLKKVHTEAATKSIRSLHSIIKSLVNLDEFIKFPSTTLLNPQPALELNVFEEDPRGLNRFVYGTQKTPFLGREQEIDALENFLTDNTAFCWWMLIGQGGLGKSRLALELCLRNGNPWRAGFLPSRCSLAAYENWVPNQPTLIIADYAASRPTVVGEIVRIMKGHADRGDLQFPVRLLLLERRIERYYSDAVYNPDVRQEEWFANFLGRGGSEKAAARSVWYANGRNPIELGSLDASHTWTVIRTFAKEKAREEEKGRLLDELKRIDYLSRPLYAAMLGDAMAAGRSPRQWDAGAILRDVLKREEGQFWPAGVTKDDKDVLALATMAGAIDTKDPSLPREFTALISHDHFSLARYSQLSPGSTHTILKPLEPDIIGEMFVLEHLDSTNPHRDQVTKLACVLNGDSVTSFVLRATNDFPNHPTLHYFLGIP